jgi:hypothetical protein
MHDIRKPFTRSSSNPHRDLNSRVEQFETRSYEEESYEERGRGPVQIPVKRTRRNLQDMDMYPRRRMDDVRYEDEEVQYEDEREERGGRREDDRRAPVRRARRDSQLGTWIFIIVVVVLAIGAGLLTYVFNSATVTIVPKYKDVTDLNKTITFSQKVGTADVPYIIATTTLSKSKTLSLSESRKVESKASGKVVIYNNYDSAEQKLIKNTRLESASGKIYRINQSITVPGKKGDTPGSVEVTVFADSNGTTYNSDPTDFTIPGFKGTPREKSFYGRSKGAITGGSSGNVSSASLSDINAAKDELAIELAQEIKSSLMKIEKEGYIGLYSASEITYDDNEAEILKGKTGTYEVTATGYLILADAGKLSSSIARDLRDYANEEVRLGYAETLVYTRKDTDHIASSTSLSILTQGKPRIIWVTNKDSIKEAVKDKKRDEFKPIMKGLTTVVGAEINFSPLWLSSFPDDLTKINVVESLPKR